MTVYSMPAPTSDVPHEHESSLDSVKLSTEAPAEVHLTLALNCTEDECRASNRDDLHCHCGERCCVSKKDRKKNRDSKKSKKSKNERNAKRDKSEKGKGKKPKKSKTQVKVKVEVKSRKKGGKKAKPTKTTPVSLPVDDSPRVKRTPIHFDMGKVPYEVLDVDTLLLIEPSTVATDEPVAADEPTIDMTEEQPDLTVAEGEHLDALEALASLDALAALDALAGLEDFDEPAPSPALDADEDVTEPETIEVVQIGDVSEPESVLEALPAEEVTTSEEVATSSEDVTALPAVEPSFAEGLANMSEALLAEEELSVQEDILETESEGSALSVDEGVPEMVVVSSERVDEPEEAVVEEPVAAVVDDLREPVVIGENAPGWSGVEPGTTVIPVPEGAVVIVADPAIVVEPEVVEAGSPLDDSVAEDVPVWPGIDHVVLPAVEASVIVEPEPELEPVLVDMSVMCPACGEDLSEGLEDWRTHVNAAYDFLTTVEHRIRDSLRTDAVLKKSTDFAAGEQAGLELSVAHLRSAITSLLISHHRHIDFVLAQQQMGFINPNMAL